MSTYFLPLAVVALLSDQHDAKFPYIQLIISTSDTETVSTASSFTDASLCCSSTVDVAGCAGSCDFAIDGGLLEGGGLQWRHSP
eukprot:COSAG02_NODE_114_length_35585_cov_149.458293_18_plen_84_part_00